jgi:hypothetical protein
MHSTPKPRLARPNLAAPRVAKTRSSTGNGPAAKKKTARKRPNLRIRYNKEQNTVEIWLPEDKADAMVKIKRDDPS